MNRVTIPKAFDIVKRGSNHGSLETCTMMSQNKLDRTYSHETVYVTASEWRWVIILGVIFVLLAFTPLILVSLRGTPNWQFMGILHNFQDGATYFSKMRLGFIGDWLVQFQHTSEPQNGALIQLLYPLLGHFSHLTNLPIAIVFHVVRAIAALMMYLSLYYLAAVVWSNIRSRRLFFIIVSVGAGFGWFLAPLLNTIEFPDFAWIPEAFPFLSSLMNVHFPLTIGCIAILASLLILILRPGAETDPALSWTPLSIAILSIFISVLYPQALVPIGLSLAGIGVLYLLNKKSIPRRFLHAVLAIGLPALPFAGYYLISVQHDPVLTEWNRQNVTLSPPFLYLLLGFGLPLILAIPALIRAIRRMEMDGDRFMLLWLGATVVLMYLPTNFQRRFAVGIMLPIAYFAVRGIDQTWIKHVNRKAQRLVAVVLIFVMSISPLFALFLPILPALAGNPAQVTGIFLPSDYFQAYRAIDVLNRPNDVVLASPVVSTWIPGWTRSRVVYGHPYETLDADRKLNEVNAWFSGELDADACTALIEQYSVRYVLVGPEELALGTPSCTEGMRVVAEFPSVTVYAP